MQNTKQWAGVEKVWKAPPRATFPESVGGFHRAAEDAGATVPDRGLAGPGRHAVYEGPNGQRMDLYAYQTPGPEGTALINRVRGAIGSRTGSGSRWVMSFPNRFEYKVSPPADRGVIWTGQGLAFFARNQTANPSPFLRAYLSEVSARAQPAPKREARARWPAPPRSLCS